MEENKKLKNNKKKKKKNYSYWSNSINYNCIFGNILYNL